jgi:WD40 repeat protein
MVALSLESEIVELWDASSGMVLQTLDCISPPVRQIMYEEGGIDGYLRSVSSIVFSPDGKTLVSASGMTVKVWDAESGVARQTLEGHSSWVCTVTFSLDGKALMSASDDGTVKLWDVGSGVELQTLKSHSHSFNAVAFSADSKMLALVSYITVKLWDVGSGVQLQTLEGHSDSVNALVFSPDGKTLASASDDGTVKLWDAGSGAELQTLKGHSDSVRAVAFSPDGKTLASASDDTVKLWATSSGALLQTFDGRVIVKSLSFSDDSTSLQINRGALSISLPRSNGTAIPQPRALPFIYVKDQWVSHKSERILWLPSEYRSAHIVVYGDTIVLGCRSGRVTIMEFTF